jgi:hypothetical protein
MNQVKYETIENNTGNKVLSFEGRMVNGIAAAHLINHLIDSNKSHEAKIAELQRKILSSTRRYCKEGDVEFGCNYSIEVSKDMIAHTLGIKDGEIVRASDCKMINGQTAYLFWCVESDKSSICTIERLYREEGVDYGHTPLKK